jgi:hypothetical protein
MLGMELENKTVEYATYILRHVSNVRTAYELLKDPLISTELGINVGMYSDMSARITRHDQSKYNEPEFSGYRQWFYPVPGEVKDKFLFDKAWEHHYTVNDHHPEHYYSNNKTSAREMPIKAVCEMFCDWLAMSINFHSSPARWYEKHQKESPFIWHPNTEALIDEYLPIVDDTYFNYIR